MRTIAAIAQITHVIGQINEHQTAIATAEAPTAMSGDLRALPGAFKQ